MNEIKSLANRLRNELRSGETENKAQEAKNKESPSTPGKKQKKLSPDELKADQFFEAILSFQVETTEKKLDQGRQEDDEPAQTDQAHKRGRHEPLHRLLRPSIYCPASLACQLHQ
jgi:hypothetical protein